MKVCCFKIKSFRHVFRLCTHPVHTSPWLEVKGCHVNTFCNVLLCNNFHQVLWKENKREHHQVNHTWWRLVKIFAVQSILKVSIWSWRWKLTKTDSGYSVYYKNNNNKLSVYQSVIYMISFSINKEHPLAHTPPLKLKKKLGLRQHWGGGLFRHNLVKQNINPNYIDSRRAFEIRGGFSPPLLSLNWRNGGLNVLIEGIIS